VKSAMRDTPLLTADAQKLMSTPQPMSDVYFGEMEFVKLAPKDGSLTKMEFVFPLVTFAHHGMKNLEIVLNATMDLMFKKESVLPILTLVLYQKVTFSAKSGLKKLVLNALPEVSSMKMENVSQLAPNATLMIRPLDIALLVLVVMI